MANYPYTYIGILNELCSTIGEVEVSNGEFDNLIGFHAHVKAKINVAIQDIYSEEDNEWPFALTLGSQAVTVGFTGAVAGALPEYSLPVTAVSADWDSFYVARNDALTEGDQAPLTQMSWDVYRKYYRDADANSLTTEHSKPTIVVRKQDNKFMLTPLAEEAYTVKYEYFAGPTALSATSDVPSIPEKYKQVILDKVMYYAYMYRDNVEEAALVEDQYQKGLAKMRRALIPQDNTLRYID